MKKYIKPELEITEVKTAAQVICTSGGAYNEEGSGTQLSKDRFLDFALEDELFDL